MDATPRHSFYRNPKALAPSRDSLCRDLYAPSEPDPLPDGPAANRPSLSVAALRQSDCGPAKILGPLDHGAALPHLCRPLSVSDSESGPASIVTQSTPGP